MSRVRHPVRTLALVLPLLGTLGWPSAARAWDPATTHSGLTGRAVAASKLHAALAERLGRALGLFEPLRLDPAALDADTARALQARLDVLDAAGGCRPSAEGIALAEAWVRAGAVLEKTPPERGRNHFLDPRKGTGLDDSPGLSGAVHAVRLTVDDGATVRQAATGQAFDLEGMSALDWLRRPQNDLGLPALLEKWQKAVASAKPAERDAALVQALLALGGTLAVLEDMGQPAFVRNDFRGEFLAHDDGSALERFVARRYGAVALPAPGAAVSRPDLDGFFMASDGQGLAQRTQAGFFSAGTVPADVRIVPGEPVAQLLDVINGALSFAAPAVSTVVVEKADRVQYLKQDGGRILAYQRRGGSLHFFLDDAVHADYARRWLPVIGAYAVGLVDHLLRVTVALSLADGKATVRVNGLEGAADGGPVLVLAEDGSGTRKAIGQAPLPASEGTSFSVPAGTKKVAAVLTGRDGRGAFLTAAEVRVP